jgi:hypothetical protein
MFWQIHLNLFFLYQMEALKASNPKLSKDISRMTLDLFFLTEIFRGAQSSETQLSSIYFGYLINQMPLIGQRGQLGHTHDVAIF